MIEAMRQAANAVSAAGFEVYMRDAAKDTWLYFTDGKNIGCLQDDRMRAVSLTTVHMPNQTTGTGYNIAEGLDPAQLTRETLTKAFCTAPSWASSRDLASIRKFKDWNAFTSYSRFNAEYKKVEG